MKLYAATTLLFALMALAGEEVHGQELRGGARNLEENCVLQLFSQFNPGLCMAVRGKGSNSRVKLGQDCSTFCTEDNGLLRMEDTNLCLQASHGSVLEDGSKMRLYPCDKNNEFQQFSWIDDGRARPMMLKSQQYNNLCATNRGVNAVKGDPIIFKECGALSPVERQEWFGD